MQSESASTVLDRLLIFISDAVFKWFNCVRQTADLYLRKIQKKKEIVLEQCLECTVVVEFLILFILLNIIIKYKKESYKPTQKSILKGKTTAAEESLQVFHTLGENLITFFLLFLQWGPNFAIHGALLGARVPFCGNLGRLRPNDWTQNTPCYNRFSGIIQNMK
jgi:hypothetical protein